MDSTLFSLVVLLVGLIIGGGLGWLSGSRPNADLRVRLGEAEAEARDRDEKIKAFVRDLATESEKAKRVDELRNGLDKAREDNSAIQAKLVKHEANADHFAEQQRILLEAKDALTQQFEAAGAKVLAGAQEAFLKRAQDRFSESEKISTERLNALLAPVDQRLKSYVERVAAMEAKNADGFGLLTGQIEAMRSGQEAVRAEAARLGNSLRNAPKARGRWGEQQLRNVLEQCGLAEHTDFSLEHSIETDEGRLRPDAIVRVPGNKLLVIDAKVSLNAYQDAFEAQDDAARDIALEAHAQSMKNHIQTLAAKSYQSQFEEAPDYVLMFVPGEHFIAAALEHDPKLWDFAFDRRVLLASPTNLVAIARTVAQVWRQDGLATEAREIGRMGGELYDRIAKVTEDLNKVGTHLGRAVGSYNDFARSFESRVTVSAKRLKDKHIEVGKREIEAVAQLEVAPRNNKADDEGLLLNDSPADPAAAAE